MRRRFFLKVTAAVPLPVTMRSDLDDFFLNVFETLVQLTLGIDSRDAACPIPDLLVTW